MTEQNKARFDGVINIGICITLIAQLVAVVTLFNSMGASIAAVEIATANQQSRISLLETKTQALEINAATVVQKLEYLADGQSDIQRAIEEQSKLIREISKGGQ